LLSSADHWALTVALGPFAAWAAVTAMLLLRPKVPASPPTNGHRPRP
jgi:hypothetical protein